MILRKLTHEMRVETEEEAVQVIEDFKSKSKGLVTYKTTYKEKKSKGEVVETYYILTVVEDFTKI